MSRTLLAAAALLAICTTLISGCKGGNGAGSPDALADVDGVRDADAPGWYMVRVFYGTDRDAVVEPPPARWPFRHFVPVIVLVLVAVPVAVLGQYLREATRWRLILQRLAAPALEYIAGGMFAFAMLLLLAAVIEGFFPPPGERPTLGYGSERAELTYGNCAVSIPKDHKIGRLESPSLVRFQLEPDPREHVTLQRVKPCDRDTFLSMIADSFDQPDFRRDHIRSAVVSAVGFAGSPHGYGPMMAAAALSATPSEKQVFVFVHGYSVSFEDAARRTAQLWYDLSFPGPPIFFSWPSQGSLTGYTRDETNAEWCVPHLKAFLADIARKTRATKVHLIAHSMGNRCLTNALRSLKADPGGIPASVCEVILTAPDIDKQVFLESILPDILGSVRRVTLYASSMDMALQASKTIHGYPRAGESGDGIVLFPPMDSIDVSAVDTSLVGHSYYGDNSSLISDLFLLLRHGHPPHQRFGMKEMTKDGKRYFVFRPRH